MVEWKGSVEGDGGRKAIVVDDSQPSSSGGKGSVEGDGGRKAIMVDDSQPSSSGGAGEGSDAVACRAQIGTLGFITSRSRRAQIGTLGFITSRSRRAQIGTLGFITSEPAGLRSAHLASSPLSLQGSDRHTWLHHL
ncbi:hypothetical protein ACOMHN_006438 [Nucella lapillus]